MCLSNRNIWLIRCITKFFPGIFLQCFSVSPVVVVACDVRERWAGAPSSTSSGVEHQQSVGDIPGSDRLWQGGAAWLHTTSDIRHWELIKVDIKNILSDLDISIIYDWLCWETFQTERPPCNPVSRVPLLKLTTTAVVSRAQTPPVSPVELSSEERQSQVRAQQVLSGAGHTPLGRR